MSSDKNIYGEEIPDRINKKAPSEKIEYPKQLILTFDDLLTPSVGKVMTQVRQYILSCKSSSVNPEVVLNFCISYMIERDLNSIQLYQNYITLAEYLHNIKSIDESISITIMVRGNFPIYFQPLLYLNVPVLVSKNTLFHTGVDAAGRRQEELLVSFLNSINTPTDDIPTNKDAYISKKLIILK